MRNFMSGVGSFCHCNVVVQRSKLPDMLINNDRSQAMTGDCCQGFLNSPDRRRYQAGHLHERYNKQ
jgi:hypothetical protein